MIGRRPIAFLFLLLPLVAHAQRPAWELGAFGGWLFGAPTAIDRASSAIRTFRTNGQGISWENSAIGGVRFGLSLTPNSAISLQAAYSQTHGEFKSDYFLDTDQVVRIFRLVEDVDAAHLSAHWQYAISQHTYASAGLSAQYRVRTNAFERTEAVDLPLRSDTVAQGSAILTSAFALGIPVSLGLRIDPTSWLTVAPELNGLIDLSELARGGGMRALRGGASVSLLFHASTDTIALPPPIAQSEPEPETIVKLHFTDEGIATHHVIATAADTVITRYIELPRLITLDASQLDIQLSSSDDSIDLAALVRRPIADAYRHYFDIIALRLHEQPQSTITMLVIGDAAERAEQALTRFFLQRQFDAHRIRIQTRRTKEDAVTITIDSSSQLISPLIGRFSELSYILPTISLEKFIANPRGVRRWEITLSEEGHILKKWSSDDGPEPIVFPPLSLSAHRLLGRLDVTDSSGRTFLDYDSLVVDLPGPTPDTATAAERLEFAVLPPRTRSTVWHRLVMQELRTKPRQPMDIWLDPLTGESIHKDEMAHEILSSIAPAMVNEFHLGARAIGTGRSHAEEAYLVTLRRSAL